MRHLPNALTLVRLGLVYPVVVLLLDRRFAMALGVFLIAGVTDALDGFLAKRWGWRSRLGAILDPLADKALLVASYLTLTWLGLIPVWLTAAVIGRDAVIVLGAVVYHFMVAPLHPSPTPLSKFNTLAQIAAAVAVMVNQGLFPLPSPWMEGMFYGVLATTLLSGADYLWSWGRQAWSIKHGRSASP